MGIASHPGAPTRHVLAQLAVSNGIEAVAFYRQAFGAMEVYRVGGDEQNRELVAQLSIGEASFWVSDESPEHLNFSPDSLGGSTVRMLLIVDEPRLTLERAVAAGARQVRPVAAEHGWLLGRIEDPFGHHWEIGKPLIDWPPASEL